MYFWIIWNAIVFVYPVENGLSDHDTQIIVLQEMQIPFQKITQHIKLDS
jgi:hypothetical protein